MENSYGGTDPVHDTHRFEGKSACYCALCHRAGDALIDPCATDEAQRKAYDSRQVYIQHLGDNQAALNLGLIEVREEMLVAFLEQVAKYAKAMLLEDYLVALTSVREYAGQKRYGVVVTVPIQEIHRHPKPWRWFEDGSWS